MRNYYKFRFDGEFLNHDFLLKECLRPHKKTWGQTRSIANSLYSNEGKNFLRLLSLDVFESQHAQLFIGYPGFKTGIHTDGGDGKISPEWAINYIANGDNSTISWFKVKPHVKEKRLLFTEAQTPYLTYDESEVEEIESVTGIANQLILFRTDIPHQIINNGNSIRYCASIRYYLPSVVTWEDAISKFSKHLILDANES